MINSVNFETATDFMIHKLKNYSQTLQKLTI